MRRTKVIKPLGLSIALLVCILGGTPLLGHLYQQQKEKSFEMAVIHGDEVTLKEMLAHGSDPNTIINCCPNKPTPTTFFKNSLRGDLREPRPPRTTPLMLAIIHRQQGAAKLLLQYGARPDETDEFGFTALYMAISVQEHSLIQLLLKYHTSMSVPNEYRMPALCWALDMHDTTDIPIMLNYGADPNVLDQDGRPALYLAILLNNIPAVKTLLFHAADPSLTFHGWSCIELAEAMHNIKALRLIHHGAG